MHYMLDRAAEARALGRNSPPSILAVKTLEKRDWWIGPLKKKQADLGDEGVGKSPAIASLVAGHNIPKCCTSTPINPAVMARLTKSRPWTGIVGTGSPFTKAKRKVR